MKALGILLVLLFGSLLIFSTMEFPSWGDPAAPASTHVSPHYIEQTMTETSVPNIVTAVLADYRGFDTMFETIVIFSAGVAAIFLLRIFRSFDPESRMYRHIPTGITLRISAGGPSPRESGEFERIDLSWVPYSIVVRTACRMIVPFCQLFALYVIAHGPQSGRRFPGGCNPGGLPNFVRHIQQPAGQPGPYR